MGPHGESPTDHGMRWLPWLSQVMVHVNWPAVPSVTLSRWVATDKGSPKDGLRDERSTWRASVTVKNALKNVVEMWCALIQTLMWFDSGDGKIIQVYKWWILQHVMFDDNGWCSGKLILLPFWFTTLRTGASLLTKIIQPNGNVGDVKLPKGTSKISF